MNLRQLQCFSLAAQLHSFSLASERLYISQPAVTQQIQALENEVGCQLFHRSNRGITLTAEGQQLLASVNQILQIWDGALQQLHPSDPEETICIGYIGPPPTQLFAWLSARLNSQQPRLHLTYSRFSRRSVAQAIQSREAALVFGENYSSWHAQGVRFIPLHRERHFLVLPADHPLAGRASLALTDLAGETFVLPSRRPWIDHLNRLCELPGGELLEHFIPAADFMSYASDVLAYRAVAIIPERMYPRSDQVAAVPLEPDIPFYDGFLGPQLLPQRSQEIVRLCKEFLNRPSGSHPAAQP